MKKSTKKGPAPKPPTPWDRLLELIGAYRDAAIAESWKGGGDPADFELLEVRLKLAELELQAQIDEMQRTLDEV